jgi:predicted transcriptional regulator
MLTPEECLNILRGLLERQNAATYMTTFMNLASELVGLITHEDIATSRQSQEIKNSFSGCAPPILSPPYKTGP